jgi:hypothetical protein
MARLPMKIKGLHIETTKALTVIFIENFSSEIQKLIRDQLSGIYHGFAEVEECPDIYSYTFTLSSFLDRFESKSEDTKKGMIGELLAHVIIYAVFNQFSSLSVLKNKEERSIRKGFDIIYYHEGLKNLWYTEVKAGKSKNGSASSDEYNIALLGRSRDGILDIFESKRSSLWESALIDVKLVVEEGSRRYNIRQLLAKDIPTAKKRDSKKNVILVSVLYHGMKDKMTIEQITSFYKDVTGQKKFKDVLILSIQKETYEKVAKFLKKESKKK